MVIDKLNVLIVIICLLFAYKDSFLITDQNPIKMFQMNYLLNSSAKQDLFILTSCLKRLPSNYIIQLCPVSTRGVPSPQDPPRTSNIPSLPVQPLETMLQKYIK